MGKHSVAQKLQEKECQFKWILGVGFILELANLIVFLETSYDLPEERAENATELSPMQQLNATLTDAEDGLSDMQRQVRLYLTLTIGAGIVAALTFILVLLDCCKKDEILKEIVSNSNEERKRQETLKKSVDELKDQLTTAKVDILEDLEASLLRKPATTHEPESELVLTPAQVSWMEPGEGSNVVGSLPQIR
jgi:hypothetical protein